MKRDYKLRIDDILECMDIIQSYLKGKKEGDFYKNHQLQDAVIRRLEIIGEAAKHIPQSIRSKYPEIPWKKMAGLRDVIIHDYVDLVIQRVWNTVVNVLPKTKKLIQKVKKDLSLKQDK